MKSKKKFDIMSILISVVTLTILAIGALVFGSFMGDLGDDLQTEATSMADAGSISEENANISTDFLANDLENYNDNYVFWFFVAIFIGLLLVGLFLEFEPSVMIILFVFGSIAVLGAWMGSEIYGEFAQDESLAVTSAEMGKTELLMSNPYFPVFIFVALIVMIVIMYNKKSSGVYQ